jgi:hypothetical protein
MMCLEATRNEEDLRITEATDFLESLLDRVFLDDPVLGIIILLPL